MKHAAFRIRPTCRTLLERARPERDGLLSWLWRAALCLAFLNAVALWGVSEQAKAADAQHAQTIDCQVANGRGATSFGRSKHLGDAAGTHRFAPWVFSADGLNLRDRVGLFWTPAAGRNRALRVAIDGPVTKPAEVISATDHSVVAVATTSDQYTTRSWLITINFRNELVMMVATATGAVAVKGQVMILACGFQAPEAIKVGKSAADTWRR